MVVRIPVNCDSGLVPLLFRSFRFCLNYLIALAATFLAMMVLQVLGGLKSGFAVLVILPLIASGMVEGQVFVRRYGHRPTVPQCWQASLRMTAMVVLMMLSVAVPLLVLSPGSLADLAEVDATGRAAVYLLLCFISCCTLRIGYAIGLATELKAKQFPDN